MEAIQTPTSSQLPTNLTSTINGIHEDDIQSFQDANYVEDEINGFNDLQPFERLLM